MTTVAEIGEFGLIARLLAGLPQPAGVLLGAGDDAAALEVGAPNQVLVATCDAQVQDIHFRLATATPAEIGRRVLAVNISDIAAMGAAPRFALISLLVPPTLEVATLDGIYAGLRDEAERFGVAIVGGNVARNPERLVIDVTLLGMGARGSLLQRDGAQPGDVLLVTGTLGAAAAGLHLLEDPALASRMSAADCAPLLAAQRTPVPQVAAGQWLARFGATAAMDISDGLAADLGHLCAASHVGAQVDAHALPLDQATRACAATAGADVVDWALFGGEDYQLLFTVPPARVADCQMGLLAATGVTATPLGVVESMVGIRLIRQGVVTALPATGWDHFAERARIGIME